jgi:hypothetical protein
MEKMTKEDLLELFDGFINDRQLFNYFREYLEEKGYSEDEYDSIMNELLN